MFSRSMSILPIQSTIIWSVQSIHGIHGGGDGGQTDGSRHWYKNQTSLQLRRLPVRPQGRRVGPILERLQGLAFQNQKLHSKPTCPVRHLMSLIGLLIATVKQVH